MTAWFIDLYTLHILQDDQQKLSVPELWSGTNICDRILDNQPFHPTKILKFNMVLPWAEKAFQVFLGFFL